MATVQLLIVFSLFFVYASGQKTCDETLVVDGSHTVTHWDAKGYAPFTNCKYSYTSKNGQPLKVTASQFSMEGIMGCRYDRVNLYDGSSNNAPMIGTFCGKNGPKNVRTTGNQLFMDFKTDELTHKEGFSITIEETCSGDYLCSKKDTSGQDKCYNQNQVNDGKYDCEDGSDELFTKSQCGDFLPDGLTAGNTLPAAVAITQADGFIHCGGVLLDIQFILSSAHCFHRLTDKPYRFVAKVGNTNLASADTYQIEKIINHPSFNPLNLQNNLAVIKLHNPVAFSANVQPICISKEDSVPTNCQTFGWGRTVATGINSYSTTMKVLSTTSAACSNIGSTVLADTTKTCQRFNDKPLCYGDNGGPLVCKNAQNKYQVYGINSLSTACTASSFGTKAPGVFNKVSGAFHDWITKTIASA